LSTNIFDHISLTTKIGQKVIKILRTISTIAKEEKKKGLYILYGLIVILYSLVTSQTMQE